MSKVNLRVIVLTYNRPESLSKCLKSFSSLVTDGYWVAMDIWIDVYETLRVGRDTLRTAASFNWNQGPVTVWVHSNHVGLFGQWIYTWRPVMVKKQQHQPSWYCMWKMMWISHDMLTAFCAVYTNPTRAIRILTPVLCKISQTYCNKKIQKIQRKTRYLCTLSLEHGE